MLPVTSTISVAQQVNRLMIAMIEKYLYRFFIKSKRIKSDKPPLLPYRGYDGLDHK
jgi:hypothetical protein